MKQKLTKKNIVLIASSSQTIFLLVGPVVLCLLIGLWLDNTFNTTPWLLILGVLVGFSTSIWNIYTTIIKQNS